MAFSPPLRAWIWDEDRVAGFPVMDWASLTVDQGKWDTSTTATLTVREDSYWLSQSALDINTPAYAARISMDVFWQDFTTPIFTGPAVTVKTMETRQGRMIVFSFDHFLRHFSGRRVHLSTSTTGAKYDFGALTADNALAALFRQNGFNAGATLTPANYSQSRTDFDDWDPTASTAPGTHGTTINLDVSWGRRIREEAETLAELYGLWMDIEETSAATWDIDFDSAYQNNDYSDEIVLDLRRGTLSDFALTRDYTPIENTVSYKVASGASSAQWASSGTAAWGVYEGVYSADEFDLAAAGQTSTATVTKFANGRLTYEGTIVDQPGATFNSDYTRRDLITIRSIATGEDTTKLVIGSKIEASGRTMRGSIVVADPPIRFTRAVMEADGTMMGGGRGMGGRFKKAIP